MNKMEIKMEIYNENSEKVKSAKTGTFTTQIISISKTSGSKYIPADRPVNERSNYKTYPKWSMKMQEIVTTDGIYITYNETEWTINEFKSQNIEVTTTPSNRVSWKWIHLAKGCDCWKYSTDTRDKKSCF